MENIMEYRFELDKTAGEMPRRQIEQIENIEQRNAKWDSLLKDYNIYDLRKIFHLYNILSTEISTGCRCDKTAVIVNLYYEDQVKTCCAYLCNIPAEVDLYICTSKQKVSELVAKYMLGVREFTIVKKENRGRDISALLVACKRYINKYEYICFVHDKKSCQFSEPAWAESWFYSMWENTLSSETFIRNVIHCFKTEDRLGILAIPEPFHGCYYSYLGGLWGSNYEETLKLCRQLGVKSRIDKDKQPITLGTVFWCKRKALAPLFEHDFKYEDFPEEPMGKDGTISHAIERSLGYIAQSKGYYTSTLMTEQFGALRIGALYEMFVETTLALRTYNELKIPSDVSRVDTVNRKIGLFCKQHKRVYIYGAGKKGQRCLRLLRQLRVDFNGFVVSDGYRAKNEGCFEKVYELHEVIHDENFGIIVALNEENAREAERMISKAGVKDIIYF